jgi:thioredoxin reductase
MMRNDASAAVDRPRDLDVAIVGAGPAGLNAALVLGRARRRVLVLDNASPRNAATHAMHGVLGHDGLDPADLRARGRAELARYGVDVIAGDVVDIAHGDGHFEIAWEGGSAATRTLLLATGMLDELPDVDGFADVWGTSAHTCPYCDGFEHRNERIAVLASGARAAHMATLLGQWSSDVAVASNGPHGLTPDDGERLEALGVQVLEAPIAELESDRGQLRAIRFDDGELLERDAAFFYVGWKPRTGLARRLGCVLREDGTTVCDAEGATSVDGVYAAGNCADPKALVPTAAGDGVRAAVAINVRLTFQDAEAAVAARRARQPDTGAVAAGKE